jgi:hypothetical protein
LVLSKLVAGRPKDLEFAVEARRAGMLDLDELRRRSGHLHIEDRLRAAVAGRIKVLERTA